MSQGIQGGISKKTRNSQWKHRFVWGLRVKKNWMTLAISQNSTAVNGFFMILPNRQTCWRMMESIQHPKHVHHVSVRFCKYCRYDICRWICENHNCRRDLLSKESHETRALTQETGIWSFDPWNLATDQHPQSSNFWSFDMSDHPLRGLIYRVTIPGMIPLSSSSCHFPSLAPCFVRTFIHVQVEGLKIGLALGILQHTAQDLFGDDAILWLLAPRETWGKGWTAQREPKNQNKSYSSPKRDRNINSSKRNRLSRKLLKPLNFDL